MKKEVEWERNLFLFRKMIAKYSKRIAIVLGVIILIGLFVLWLLIRRGRDSEETPTVIPTPTLFDINQLPQIPSSLYPTYPPTPIPKEGDLIVSGIAIADFRQKAEKVLPNGDVLIKSTGQYQIIYTGSLESFLISIQDDDFPRTWAAAERDFLVILGIDKPNACRLTVEITSPASAHNEYAGMVFPLSFCEHHETDDEHL